MGELSCDQSSPDDNDKMRVKLTNGHGPVLRVSESPMTELLNNVAGARALYAFLGSLFTLIATCEEFKCYYNEEERVKRYNFWSGQFSTLPHFFVIWLYMHVVLWLVVYPAGKLMRDKSNLLCAFSSITSILLVKYIVYHCTRQYSAEGQMLSATMGVAIGCESTRIFMKIISYLAECTKSDVRSKATLSNFTYFLFAPTLIYKSEYTRTPGPVKWGRALKYLLEFAFIIYMKGLWFKGYFEPMVHTIQKSLETNVSLSRDQLMQSLLHCCLSAVIIYLVVAYGFLHFYLNSWAEVLRYSDRQFYLPWWTATSPSQMMRQWNLVVHRWLHQYLFTGLSRSFGKWLAVAVVFIVSGVYHDYVLFLTVGFVTPSFTIVMAITALTIMADPLLQEVNKSFPSFLFILRNYWGMTQLGLIVALVTVEYQARRLCPSSSESSTVSDLTTLRFPHCLKVQ